ncbi:MAG: 3-keto-5-aminohexanoate cleavage protein, partial [Hydrogenophaga sp.]|nr:3-keto-5-aminohexanoate cleavage protein [Hydrogenophaga sp.]
ADEAIAAAKAGAAIAHIHVRDPNTGLQSMALEHYREVVDRIRDSDTDVVINLTGGPGARFIPSEESPRVGTPESTITSPEARVEHIVELKPELCSLDMGTFNMRSHAFINLPSHLSRMANLITAAGVKPEMEVFDAGHVRLAAKMVLDGEIAAPPLFQLCLGVRWGAAADAETMLYMRNQLPPGAMWAAFGISHHQFPCVALAAAMGGHVRVGLEDNLYVRKGQLANGNADLVAQAKQIIHAMGSEIATPAEARQLLGLRQPR